MRVGIIQSCYIPWRGYFDFIDSVDLFIFHDDIQYTKSDWRNRNIIKTPRGQQWLTVPVKCKKFDQLINQTEIDYSQNWIRRHVNLLTENYRTAQFFDLIADDFIKILNRKYDTISELNIATSIWIMEILHIDSEIKLSNEYAPVGSKTERLIDILKKAGATTYLSGPSASNYLNEEMFKKHGIRLEYKSYEYLPYPQLWGYFQDNVTALDLIANTGPQARKYFKSKTSDQLKIK